MNPLDPSPFILTINGGSSSITFALFRDADRPVPVTRGMVDRVGLPNSEMVVTDATTQQSSRRAVHAPDHRACVGFITGWLEQRSELSVSLLSGIVSSMVGGPIADPNE
jgi:acetate kinase